MSDKYSMEFWCTKFQETVKNDIFRKMYFTKLNHLMITVQKYMRAFIWNRISKNNYSVNMNEFKKLFRYPVTNMDIKLMAESKKYYKEMYDIIQKWNLFHVMTTENMYRMHETRPPTRSKQVLQEIKVKIEPSDNDKSHSSLEDEKSFRRFEIGPPPLDYAPTSPNQKIGDDVSAEEAVKVVKKDLKLPKLDNAEVDDIIMRESYKIRNRNYSKSKERKPRKQISAEKALEKTRKSLSIRPRMLAETFYRDKVIDEMKSRYPHITDSEINQVMHMVPIRRSTENKENKPSRNILPKVSPLKVVPTMIPKTVPKASRKENRKEKEGSKRGRKLTVNGAVLKIRKQEGLTPTVLKYRREAVEQLVSKVKQTYPQFSDSDIRQAIK